MFETIIVGVDGRQGGRDALAIAEQLRRALHSSLIAVAAYPYDFFVIRGGASHEYDLVLRDGALERLQAELDATGSVAAPVVVADSSPARALHLAAERKRADLIVVGSAHRGPIGRVLAGDVTASTLNAAPCPVLVAPHGASERERRLATIGVGYDGSPESRAALDLAREIAQAIGARLELLRVLPSPLPAGPWAMPIDGTTEQERAAEERAKGELEATVRELGGSAEGHLLTGDAVAALVDLSERVDLLVVGSRRYGPLERLLIGSTSAKLVHKAACPVLALTRGAVEMAPEGETSAADEKLEV